MKLSAPVYVLKRKAKELKRSRSITQTEALDRVAHAEGYGSWSLLQSKVNSFVPKSSEDVLDYLYPGDMLLVGARPGLGKTVMALQVLLQAARTDRLCYFFSLEYTLNDIREKLSQMDDQYSRYETLLRLDVSDAISSDYIIARTRDEVREGSLIAIDYLQLLDQQRDKPPLQKQIEDLKAYAREVQCILLFISQIDRAFDQKGEGRPSLDDVRLPNPLDLSLFNKAVFVRDGQVYV